jgi:hypothetical protein
MEHMAWKNGREASVLAVAGTGSAAASLGRKQVSFGESRWAGIWQFPCVFTVKFFAFLKNVVYFIIDM